MQISGVNKNILFMQFNQLALLAKMFLATVSVQGKIFLIIPNFNFFLHFIVIVSLCLLGGSRFKHCRGRRCIIEYWCSATVDTILQNYNSNLWRQCVDIFRRDSELVVSRDMLYETFSISKTYFKTTLAPFRLNIQKCC